MSVQRKRQQRPAQSPRPKSCGLSMTPLRAARSTTHDAKLGAVRTVQSDRPGRLPQRCAQLRAGFPGCRPHGAASLGPQRGTLDQELKSSARLTSAADRTGLCRVWLRRVAGSAACRARSSAVAISVTASSVPSVTSDQNGNPNADNVSGITNPLSIFVPVGQKSSVLLNFGSPRGRSLVRNRRASLARALGLGVGWASC